MPEPDSTAELPLPVAALVRRARNAKSPKERHDAAFYAWESSLRLAVALRPPADPRGLVDLDIDRLVDVFRPSRSVYSDPRLRRAANQFETTSGIPATSDTVDHRELLEGLRHYHATAIARGGLREPIFYERAVRALDEGLEAAWATNVFWPPGRRLVYVDEIAIDAQGQRRGRLLDLTGELPSLLEEEAIADLPDQLRPNQLYTWDGEEFEALHPWVVYSDADLRERVLFYQSATDGPEMLDYVGGDVIRGAMLRDRFPSLHEEFGALLGVPFREPPQPSLPPGLDGDSGAETFGDFVRVQLLGKGGMGVVYLARQQRLGREVALKVLRPGFGQGHALARRFEHEIRALARCEHPHVVKVFTAGTHGDQHYFAMEYIEGANLATLRDELRSSSDLATALEAAASRDSVDPATRTESDPDPDSPPAVPLVRPSARVVRELAELFAQAAAGVAHLHERGIVHRDIKPANIMVTRADRRAVVMDLGLAFFVDSLSMSDAHSVVGTLPYMAPEQLGGDRVDYRTDVYGLGVTFYELLTGERSVRSTGLRDVQREVLETPTPPCKANPAIPKPLGTILAKAMEGDPRLRHGSADELARQLEKYLAGEPIDDRPVGLPYVMRLALTRHPKMSAGIAAAVLLVAVLVTMLVSTLRSRVRLSDMLVAQALVQQEPKLYALAPDVSRMESWLADVDDLLARRAGAPGAAKDTRQVELAQTLQALRAVRDDVADRLDRARTLEHRTVVERAEDWQRARDFIRTSPHYGGADLLPQTGLVPLWPNEQGYYEFLVADSGEAPTDPAARPRGKHGVVLVLLPSGEFEMGSDDNTAWLRHRRRVRMFCLGKYEVTQAQWLRLMGSNPSALQPGTRKGQVEFKSWTLPVETIDFEEAREFARRLGLRLPSEAEWEYGARAGSDLRFGYGADLGSLQEHENVLDESYDDPVYEAARAPWNDPYPYTAPAGSFQANAFGLHDMLGNVCEWCQDAFELRYPVDLDQVSPAAAHEPADASPRASRSVRGGSWANNVHVAVRNNAPPLSRNFLRGVRVACSVQTQAAARAR